MNKPDVTIAVDGNEKMLFVKLWRMILTLNVYFRKFISLPSSVANNLRRNTEKLDNYSK
jgi:hypothetical protein